MLNEVVAGLAGLIASALVNTVTYGLICLAIVVVLLPPLLLWQRYGRRKS